MPLDAAVASLVLEADRQAGARASHLEAEALEKALALLPTGHPKRAELARRLAEVYRGSLWHFERAKFWTQTIAEELRPTPAGIDALLDYANTLFAHGQPDEALQIYREVLQRIVPPQPPYDVDVRAHKGWHGEELCKFPMGGDPLFPSDPIAGGKLGRLPQLIENRDWRSIRSLLDQNLPLQPLVQDSTGSRISFRRWARETLKGLPPETARALTAAYEPVLSDLAAKEDWRTVAAFRAAHPIAAVEQKADVLAGDKLLDAGLPALASLYYGRAAAASAEVTPELLARELFCRVKAGESVAIETVPDVAVEVGGEKKSLREWVSSWQSPSPRAGETQSQPGAAGPAGSPAAPLDLGNAVVSRLPVIRATLPLREWQLRWNARAMIEEDIPPYAEEFVPVIPAGSPRCLVVNMGDAIEALDLVEGRMLWSFLPPEQNAMTFPSQKYEPKKAFVECARTRTAVVQGDRVYCHLAWGHHDTFRQAGGLFALDARDGRMLWSSLQLPELADIMIAGDPAVDRGVVVALAWRPREALPLFFVVGLSAETGELLWINHLYSGSCLTSYENQFYLDRPLASRPPVIVDGIAYLCTQASVVAAVDIMDGTTVWATTYPRVKAMKNIKWSSRMAVSRPAGIVAVFKDTVLFAPTDAHVLLAVDRATGRVRYSQRLLDLKAIAAADLSRASGQDPSRASGQGAERVYLSLGTTIRAVRPVDGQTLWERPLPVSGLVDLPTLTARGLLCPAWEALYVLDPASGEVRQEKAWSREEACGYLLDFGDQLVGASRIGINILSGGELDETDPAWLSPEAGRNVSVLGPLAGKPLETSSGRRPPVAPGPQALAGKPPVALGPVAQEAVEIRVPSRTSKWLRWGLPAVDRGDFVLSDADPDHLLIRSELLQMRDIEPVPTLRWQRQSPLPWDCEATFSKHWVAVWNLHDVYVMNASTGRTVWEDHPLRRINRPISKVLMVGDEVRVHLGWKDGKVLPQPAPVLILFDGKTARDVTLAEVPSLASPPAVAKTPPGDVRYEFANRRIRAVSVQDGKQLWETTTLLDEVRLLTQMEGYVVSVSQDRIFRDKHVRDVCHVRAFDKSSGQRVKDIAFPKRYFHVVGERNGRLLLWDCAFLYCVKAPEADASADPSRASGQDPSRTSGQGSTIVIHQDRPDPDAISALRTARDLEDAREFEIGTLAGAPTVDGDLAEWASVESRRLGEVMDWSPDFAHRSSNKLRLFRGPEDCAADVRLAFFENDLYGAIEVSDDVHVSSTAPGLWQWDGITLLFGEPIGEKSEEIDPLLLTLSLVNGLPRFELGTVVSTHAVSDPAGQETAAGPGPRRFVLPAFNAGAIVLPHPTESIEIAARRDEGGRRTVYEFRVPKVLFRYGPDSYWDLFINDNDGAGREGALQMASATWGTEETQTGSLRGVGERPAPLKPDARQKRTGGGSATRPPR